MMRYTFIFLLLLSSLLSQTTKEQAKKLKTHWGIKKKFHSVLNEDSISLSFPGYIIGVEKASRKKLGLKKLDDIKPFLNYDSEQLNAEEKKFLVKRINDSKIQFVSHIVKFAKDDNAPNLHKKIIYNVYQNTDELQTSQVFKSGWDSILSLKEQLAVYIEKHQITHVFLCALGWNTPQQKALKNLNTLFSKVYEKASRKSNYLFIGITWPSKWGIPGISYQNKKQDAEEVGLLYANSLLHNVLLPLKKVFKFRVVLIGHSFGARLLARGLFSAHFLSQNMAKNRGKIDLFIGLQAALDIKYFLEDGEYHSFRAHAKKFVFTWSTSDKKMNAWSFTARNRFLGTKRAFSVAKDHENFVLGSVNQHGQISPQENSSKILLVDAKKIISHHSDVFNHHVAEFVSQLVKIYCKSQ
ncbi:alpha/beta hydrolase [Candidatus Uabimicrobium amorphum]|uniref:Alpha/beta hydrolase n=1 Tax=Uabimicrobium amorphum TaxID=2596890 RepID=A0A5S9F3C5_UABAM|nr:alpha/beta hydrolase [Candidatus Uabimicrobium amorphum]BBM83379.1 hypothetical protein UABAM_01731 [Candidatus Uabimicrobium amorphum]